MEIESGLRKMHVSPSSVQVSLLTPSSDTGSSKAHFNSNEFVPVHVYMRNKRKKIKSVSI
jgi:hypothetical protein